MTLEDLPEESSYQEVFADEDKDEDGDEDSDTNDEENRHGARSSKRKKSTARSLKHSGISIKQEIVYDFDIKDYSVEKPLRETRVGLPFMSSDVIFNPVTTLIGIVPLWAATIWCMVCSDIINVEFLLCYVVAVRCILLLCSPQDYPNPCHI